MSEFSALIERVKKCTGPDRDIDGELFLRVCYPSQPSVRVAPEYTGSFDAVLALTVLAGMNFHFARGSLSADEPMYAAEILDASANPIEGTASESDNAHIALLLAFLRAKQKEATSR